MKCNFKIGDHIKKVIDKLAIDKNNKIFKITDLKEIKGGNWHDGFSLTFIATIEPVLNDNVIDTGAIKPDLIEEYCIQYINYMCQINNTFVTF
jgi:hypothetical protein